MVPSALVAVVVASIACGCTLHHSKVPIPDPYPIQIAPDARFVTSDDSGLAILGLLLVSDPDHYAVLLERIRRRYNCSVIHHAQLDFYSDYWLFVSFPIVRVTAICNEPGATPPQPPSAPTQPQTPPAQPAEPTLFPPAAGG